MARYDTVIISREKNNAGPTSFEASNTARQRSSRLSNEPLSRSAYSRCLCVFSIITMAPSTIAPIVIAIPPRDIILALSPWIFITINAIKIPIGKVTIATNADLACNKNKIQTRLTTMNSSSNFSVRLSTALSIRSPRS